MKKMVPVAVMACLSFVMAAQGQTVYDSVSANASTLTAAPFLRMNTDIRSAGIGEAAIALPGDNVTHYANPARMVQVENKSSVTLAYTPWMNNLVKNVALYAVSGFFKPSSNEVISGGFRYFKQGELKQTDDYGQQIGQSNPYDMAIDASYARKLSEQLYIGASFRYIYSHILSTGYAGYQNGSAVGADLGIYYQTRENSHGQSWHFGAVATNLGSKIKYSSESDAEGYSLPATAGLGLAFRQKIDGDDQLILTGDAISPLTKQVPGYSYFQNRMQYNAGAEYGYHSLLFIRAGYSTESTNYSSLQFVTTGLGLSFKACRFDMAYLIPTGSSTASSVSNTFKLGFSFTIK